jgi:23S rRNA pseudouridine1911/1915/1917 synthase
LPDEGTIEYPIANHPKDQRRVYACVHPRDVMRYAPRPAVTRYTVEKRVGEWALVRAEASRAVRHQIRAHFAALEHPLAGDALYGGKAVPGLARHALHAARVAYAGAPELSFDVSSPLPPELASLVGD